jgi:hypothetical protein
VSSIDFTIDEGNHVGVESHEKEEERTGGNERRVLSELPIKKFSEKERKRERRDFDRVK